MAVKEGRRKCRRCERRLPYSAYPKGNAKRARLSTICRECHARRQLERERWTTDGRECPRCGELRRCPEEISFAHAPVCQPCQRKNHADRERERRRRPDVRAYYREQMRQWRQENREAAREAQRRYRQKIYSDPERAREWRDHNRIYHRLWRQRQGVKSRVSSLEQYRKIAKPQYATTIPAAPLVAAVDRMGRGMDLDALCEGLGIYPRQLLDWRKPGYRVQFDIADRILTRSDLLWWDVWDESNTSPEDLARVAVAFEGEQVAA